LICGLSASQALRVLQTVAFWCTYRIGSLLFSRRVGAWAAILVGLSTDYVFCSVEFRTDNLWAPLWLLCMSVLLNGALAIRRALIAGFLMGLCFGVSMKTLLLVMSIPIGGSVTLIFVGRERLDIGSGLVQIIALDVGTITGMLDGERYEGKERFLSRGTHTFAQTSTGHDLVVFWAQAVDRHFRPIESNRSPGS
jgi:asparagine N-glycosylation enzyme membrane subunit Stt3